MSVPSRLLLKHSKFIFLCLSSWQPLSSSWSESYPCGSPKKKSFMKKFSCSWIPKKQNGGLWILTSNMKSVDIRLENT